MSALPKKIAFNLATRFRELRPRVGVENAERRLWADMVNATTGWAVREVDVHDFRRIAGWEAEFDRAVPVAAAVPTVSNGLHPDACGRSPMVCGHCARENAERQAAAKREGASE